MKGNERPSIYQVCRGWRLTENSGVPLIKPNLLTALSARRDDAADSFYDPDEDGQA